MGWYYFAQEDPPHKKQTGWRGSNELARYSSVILRQRTFKLLGRRFFWGQPEVELELIWNWAMNSRFSLRSHSSRAPGYRCTPGL